MLIESKIVSNFIIQCASTVSYFVVLNGEVGRVFSPRRGLREGDSVSPYMFLICSEGLSSLMRMASHDGLVKRAKICCRGRRSLTFFLPMILFYYEGLWLMEL